MITVGYLTDLPDPGKPAFSGVPKVAESFLREFENRPGIRIEAIALVNDLPEPVVVQRGSVTYRHYPCKSAWKTATLFSAEIRMLRRLLTELRCDIAHGQPTVFNMLAAAGSRLPNLVTVHGLLGRETKGLGRFSKASLQAGVRELMQRSACKRTKAIISISPYVNQYLAGWTRAKIWDIPNPIDPEFFEVPPVNQEGLRILCVGSVSFRKNQLLLVKACASLQKRGIGFSCRIIGMIDPALEPDLRQTINEAGLKGSITLEGKVPASTILEAYSWANVVALPSREETSPLSLIQALAGGRIAVGANEAGTPLLLEKNRWGTVFDGASPESLANLLASVAVAPGPYFQKAASAARHAKATFHPSGVADRTLEVYRTLLGRF